MQHQVSTAELCAILSVTRMTLGRWAKLGIVVKASRGKYDLPASLKAWAEYTRRPFAAVVDREPVPAMFEVARDASGFIIAARVVP